MYLAEVFKLADVAHHRVSELPYGRQRLVELGRSPSACGRKCCCWTNLRPAYRASKVMTLSWTPSYERLPEQIAVLIIEHDMDVVFRFAKRCHRVMVSRGGIRAGRHAERDRSEPAGARHLSRSIRTRAAQWLARLSSGRSRQAMAETVVLEDIDFSPRARRVPISIIGPQWRRQDHAVDERSPWAIRPCTLAT